MEQRKLREEIFKFLFELEMNKVDILNRKEEILNSLNLSQKKRDYFSEYVLKLKENEEFLKDKIKENIKGWTFTRLGIVEKVLLKMSFYEILFTDLPHEISINEAVELAKIYGDENSKSFINGILATLVKNKQEI